MIRILINFFYFKYKYFKSGSIINSNIVSKRADIGRHVIVDKNTLIDSKSSVGDFSYLNRNCSVENSSIGRFCSIAQGVHIGPFEHIYSNISLHPFWRDPIYGLINASSQHCNEAVTKKTMIGDDVWIGLNVIVKQGVIIGTGSVIGAGSIVTKDIPPYEVWAGNPAKKIKDRFNLTIKDSLIRSKWTTLTDSQIQEFVIPNIASPENLLVHIDEYK
jgi:acetyltransferase-like isoleucine patch superfamily enzyme